MNQSLEKYRAFIARAEESVGYWAELSMVEFTEDVCRLMDEQGVSRAELARRIGSSRAYVTKLLGGNANFTLQTMTKVALALGSVVHVHVAPRSMAVRWLDEPSPPKKAAKRMESPSTRREPSAVR